MLKKTVLPQKIVFMHLFFTLQHLEGHGSQVVNGTQRVKSKYFVNFMHDGPPCIKFVDGVTVILSKK